MCVACRRSTAKRDLIRLVVAADAVQPDPSGSRPGRGAYLCGFAGCIEVALRRDGAAIRRALRLGDRRVALDASALRTQLLQAGDSTMRRERRAPRDEHSGLARLGTSPAASGHEGVNA
ncbi:MAG: YlxR family protein [Egibacteraceae bacterium]